METDMKYDDMTRAQKLKWFKDTWGLEPGYTNGIWRPLVYPDGYRPVEPKHPPINVLPLKHIFKDVSKIPD